LAHSPTDAKYVSFDAPPAIEDTGGPQFVDAVTVLFRYFQMGGFRRRMGGARLVLQPRREYFAAPTLSLRSSFSSSATYSM
jgi:hypothetical protein